MARRRWAESASSSASVMTSMMLPSARGATRLDTSRGRTRRWCDMNTCGNHEKKACLKSRRA
ncbi:CGNR zinc finger domain-containing protein [Microbacterium proteolyticum]|uniref:CGNR zinc finger domain-containing protein n=1 Tax=Microbacterium proteolyticum TaxID=1572644 RepID=UPI0027E269A7|nr:CGNR zinc finger domain-containing protein [Microbacterium proteolyticum]MCI9859148.1 CGNR zinc finger domain-containing protein [Microbacterium proteolyticum]